LKVLGMSQKPVNCWAGSLSQHKFPIGRPLTYK